MARMQGTAAFEADASSPSPQEATVQPLPVAWVFDGSDPDGRPLVRRDPVPPGEFDAVANYLQSAPMLAPPAAPGPDLLDPRRGNVVPSTWHTDGQWIWCGSVIYYLRVHGLAPQPELLDHLRRQRYALAPVGEDALQLAVAVVTGAPLPAPRPAPDDEPAPAEEPAPPQLHEPVQPGPEVPVVPTPREAPRDEHRSDSPELRTALSRAVEAAESLGIDPDRYCVDGFRDDAWCLSRDGSRWRVFQQRGQSRKGTEFDTVHEAVDFFVGHLYLHRDELRRAPEVVERDHEAPEIPAPERDEVKIPAPEGDEPEALEPAVPEDNETPPAAQVVNGTPAAQAGHESGDQSELPARSTDSSPAPNEAANPDADSPSSNNAPSATGLAPSL